MITLSDDSSFEEEDKPSESESEAEDEEPESISAKSADTDFNGDYTAKFAHFQEAYVCHAKAKRQYADTFHILQGALKKLPGTCQIHLHLLNGMHAADEIKLI